MIRYRLPHEDLPGYYICKWCGATAEAVENGRKPRYCAKNKRFKNGRPSFAVWSMSKYRVVEELVDEGLYGDFSEVAEDLVASMIDDICDTETPEQRAAYMKWFEEAMSIGSGAAQIMPGRIHEADALGLVDPGVGFHGWAFPKILLAAKDLYSFEDWSPSQEMPIPDRLQDPASWYIKDEDQEKIQTATQVHREQMARSVSPFRYKFTERLSFTIPTPDDVVKTVFTDEELANIKPGAFVNVPGEPERELITHRPISAAEHCKLFCAWKGGGPCLADDCPRREKHENGDGV